MKLLHKVYRKFMRGFILLGESGAQVGDEFTVFLILKQLLLVLLLCVARWSVICWKIFYFEFKILHYEQEGA